MRSKRRNHSAGFKVKVALGAIKGDRTIAESFPCTPTRSVFFRVVVAYYLSSALTITSNKFHVKFC